MPSTGFERCSAGFRTEHFHLTVGETIMTEHPNVAVLRNAYSAFAAGELAAVQSFFSSDAVWHVGGRGPLSGDHKGHDALTAKFAYDGTLTGGTQHLEVREVYADAEHGVVVLDETATRAADGRRLEVAETNLFRFDAAGKIVELWDIPADPEAHDAFFDGR